MCVLVLGHLRGGGELGPDMWHQGRLKNKQNSFNDVFAIAEDLIARGMTSTAKLGVVGGSNGGVMAAAVTVQRPDLFRAAIAQVPIADALARVRDPITMGATLDYGDPNDPEISEVIAAGRSSEEQSVGKECVRAGRYRVYSVHQKKKNK